MCINQTPFDLHRAAESILLAIFDSLDFHNFRICIELICSIYIIILSKYCEYFKNKNKKFTYKRLIWQFYTPISCNVCKIGKICLIRLIFPNRLDKNNLLRFVKKLICIHSPDLTDSPNLIFVF